VNDRAIIPADTGLTAPIFILLIEGDPVDEMMLIRAVAENALTYQMTVARSVTEARKILATRSFDVILADYRFPDGTSFDLMEALAGQMVIFITSRGDEEIAAQALHLGAHDYLIKDPQHNYLKLFPYRVEIALRQRRMTQELHERAAQLQDLLDGTNDLIHSFTPDGRILFANRAWCETLGYSAEEVAALNLFEIVHTDYRGHRDELVQRAMVTKEAGLMTAAFRAKDGRVIAMEGNVSMCLENGKIVATRGIFRDISGREQTKGELTEHYEKIQELDAKLKEAHDHLLQSERMTFIGQLATGVAHEINNPIGYVYSNLGTLEKYVQDVFRMIEDYESAEGAIADEGVRARLQAAREKLDIAFLKEDLRALMVESREGIVHVKNIVRDLKDFSHVDAADEWYAADLHKGLDSTLNIVHNEIKYKVEIVKQYGDIVAVECLPSQINQVFMNLLVNAVHAVEKRGTITVRTGKQDAEVWVEIADTGKGIAPADLKRIFEPFYTTKPIGQGTGLGLSLSYGIVQKHQGRMEAQSEVGKGSLFRVWLPVRQPQTENM
jgi:two-component system NtrC family sensor kinase